MVAFDEPGAVLAICLGKIKLTTLALQFPCLLQDLFTLRFSQLAAALSAQMKSRQQTPCGGFT